MKDQFSGWFVFRESPDKWENCFGVEDDDGMTFCLDSLKRFHGRDVLITIEENPSPIAPGALSTRESRNQERETMLKAQRTGDEPV